MAKNITEKASSAFNGIKDLLKSDIKENAQPLQVGQSHVDADADLFEPKELSAARKKMIQVSWMMGTLEGGDPVDGIPRIQGADFEQVLPKLRAGDVILCGNSGGLTHAMLYAGSGDVIHAMATEASQLGLAKTLQALLLEPEELKSSQGKKGVFEEKAGEFFDRYARDTYVVLRQPYLHQKTAAKALKSLREEVVGAEYDYDFIPGDNKYYCTEVVLEFFDRARGDKAPRVSANAVKETVGDLVLLERQGIIDPLNLLDSPELEIVAASSSAKKWLERKEASVE